MTKRIIWTGVALLALLTTGAAVKEVTLEVGDWPMFRRDPHHSGYTPERLVPPLELVWKYSTHQPIVSSPSVAGGMVYVGSRDSTLYALQFKTGKLHWQFKTGGWIDSSPAVGRGLIYFASRDGFVYCLSLGQGRLRWKHRSGGTEVSSPTVVGGRVYLGSGFPNTDVLALDSRTGKSLWTYRTDQPVYSSPAVGEGVVHIGSNDGRFYALSQMLPLQRTPRPPAFPKWVFPTGGGVYFSSPAMSDSLCYCIPGNYDLNIYCLRLSDGSVKWTHELQNLQASAPGGSSEHRYGGRIVGAPPSAGAPDRGYPFVYVSSPALAHATVYFVSGYPEQSVYALDALTGSLRWSQPIGSAIGVGFSSSPAVAGSVVWVGSGGGILHAFDALTGTPIWSQSLGSPIVSSPTVARGRLWVATWGGDLLCFQPSGESAALTRAESDKFSPVHVSTYALLSPTPNPFTSATTISYSVPRSAGAEEQGRHLSTYQPINLSIYDLSGGLVKTLVDEALSADRLPLTSAVSWHGTDSSGLKVPSGVYFFRLRASGFTSTRKVTLVR